VPRSAFLQKTAAPQGAALFAFAVLGSEGAEKGLNKTTPLTEVCRATTEVKASNLETMSLNMDIRVHSGYN
jgi:hypothetical protein